MAPIMALCGPQSWVSAIRQYGFAPFTNCMSPRSALRPWLMNDQKPFAVRYPESSAYSVRFQYAYAPKPATVCARPPARRGVVAGPLLPGTTLKPHAGALFHTSCTDGLLFIVA